MKTFMLIALLSLGGESHAYVLDHSLSYEDCQRAMDAGLAFGKPPLRHLQDVSLSCEPEPETKD